MTGNFKTELSILEQQLIRAYEEFKKVYAENYENKHLSNEEVYQHILDEDIIYNQRLKQIRLQVMAIFKQVSAEQDAQTYSEILDKINHMS